MDGLLLLDKPVCWTSHDLVDAVRRKTGIRAVGHAGTLDPMATGLMILLLGKATKRSAEFSGLDKTYRGSLRLGVRTDTWDLDGRLLEESEVPEFSETELRESFAALSGEQDFAPPAYSAVKIGGHRSYERARRGEAVQVARRAMRIDRLDLLSEDLPEIYFEMDCSKGTYVRSVAQELGERLGCGAALSSLVRTRIGGFHLKEAWDAQTLERATRESIEERLLSP